MQTYAYTARDERGAPTSGTLEAGSVAEVSRQLRASGKYPVSIRLASEAAGDSSDAAASSTAIPARGIKIPRREVIQLATQLAIMLETGVNLSEALECIAAQTVKPTTKRLLEDLVTQVQSGSDLSAALARHPRSFPRVFVTLIRAAEKSGMLFKLLHRATQYLRDEQEIIRRVRGALTYPLIMLAFAVSTTVFLLAFVLPRFAVIYANKKAALPVPTRVLMAISGVIVNHWVMLLLAAGALAAGGYYWLMTDRGQRAWHYVQLHLPLIGPMFRKLHLARGLRMIGTMAGAGVNLVDCVATAHDLCANVYFRQMWDDVLDKIQTGKQMSEPLSASPLVPRSISQMIHSAERSGKLAQVTEQVATYSEQELKDTIAELTRYIEPAMIVVMGAIIGGVALALMLPIFTISRVVSQ
ncbi:type II secretion system F family protein [Fontivita pretiosa]|uniref:type II secretion system F family protein n=1 Tax=Fontivita pretiosa TaxID=2989684 RepID=UPI003D17108D